MLAAFNTNSMPGNINLKSDKRSCLIKAFKSWHYIITIVSEGFSLHPFLLLINTTNAKEIGQTYLNIKS